MKNENMKKTVLGFVPIKSPIYALHPVTRIVLFIALGFIPLFIQMPEVNLLFLLLVLILFRISQVNLSQLKVYLPVIITLTCFLLASYTIFPTKLPGEMPIHIAGFPIYKYSVLWSICIYIRILTLVLSSIFFFSTNRERDILVGLRSLHMPFVASYFLGLTLRAAGMFMEDYQIVREAERARGLDMASMSWFKKLKHFPMYMIPLFTLAIRRSEDISIGLYAKGTQIKNIGVRPDYLRSLFKFNKLDVAINSVICVVFIAVAFTSLAFNTFALSHSVVNTILGNII
ncbi:energy-coupling factor transporter transmembrane component T family protein [Pectinatus frisingensis]|uniref:energy-coupling factor transporter transmembrane component T family protein n=1 Tax=Pectinatus frisingensis TaxID=865 RepID=UPI0018C579B2|nr:energy-coupling factor transporter transmembrane component T [Pectinatus frisingensis]